MYFIILIIVFYCTQLQLKTCTNINRIEKILENSFFTICLKFKNHSLKSPPPPPSTLLLICINWRLLEEVRNFHFKIDESQYHKGFAGIFKLRMVSV